MNYDELLTHQQQQLEHLLAVLDHEHQALINRDPTLLQQTAQQKIQLLQQVSQNDQQLAQLAPTLRDDPRIAAINELIAALQQKNQINGQLLELSLNSVRQLTQALLAARSADTMTYNSHGRTQGGGILGKGIKA